MDIKMHDLICPVSMPQNVDKLKSLYKDDVVSDVTKTSISRMGVQDWLVQKELASGSYSIQEDYQILVQHVFGIWFVAAKEKSNMHLFLECDFAKAIQFVLDHTVKPSLLYLRVA